MLQRSTSLMTTLAALLLTALALLCAPPDARALSQQRRQRRPAAARPKTPRQTPVAPTRQSEPADEAPAQQDSTDSAPQQPAPEPSQPAGGVAQEVGEDEVLRIDSNLVTVPATVVDAFGRSVNDLQLKDFELRVDGQIKALGEVTRAETPVRLAILFDNSASLSKAREFEKQAAVRFFQKVMRPVDQAAIYSVSTVPILARPLTGDVRNLVRTIELFPEPEGATALFDSIAKAAEYLRPHEGRKVILLVTDGNDTVSEKSFDDALKSALAADCQIYVVGTGDIEAPNQLVTLAKRRLAVLAQQTGGAVSIPQSVEDLDDAFERISNDISEQYVLSYYPTDDPADGRFRTLALQIVTRPNLRVRARRGYYARVGEGAHVRPRRARAAAAAASRAQETELKNVSFDPLNSPQGTYAASFGSDGAISGVFIVSGKNRTRAARPAQSDAAAADRPAQPVSQTIQPAARTETNPSAPAPARTAQTERTGAPSAAKEAASSRQSASAASAERQGAAPPVSGGLLNGKALSLPKPAYPAAARGAGAKGTVTVEILIDVEGRVIRARAVSGHPMLQQAAVAAARQAKFSPAYLAGQPVQVSGILNYNFIMQ